MIRILKLTLIASMLSGCQIQSGKVYQFSSLMYHYRAGFIHAEPVVDQDISRYEEALSKPVMLDSKVVGWGPDECRVIRWKDKTYLFVIPDFSYPISAWVAEVETFGRLWWSPKWVTPKNGWILVALSHTDKDFIYYMEERKKRQSARKAPLPRLKQLFR